MNDAKYRNALPQLNGKTLLTDGGLETTLVFHDEIDLPHFAAFDLLSTEKGRKRLEDYYSQYARIAVDAGQGFVLEAPTWRASRDWGEKMGYSRHALATANRAAIEILGRVRAAFETPSTPFVISGNLGPRGDGYNPSAQMSTADAQAYHAEQIGVFEAAGVDMIAFVTANYVEEAIGVARAAKALALPSAISFTVETDGALPTGQSLADAIRETDAESGNAPAYYMINCAHPDHFAETLERRDPAFMRIRGLRANASRMSHAELDNAEELDDGDPIELGAQYRDLMRLLPNLSVLGGCCGTDHRHVQAICSACAHSAAA